MACSVCGNARCIGKYLLHPKEMIKIPRIKEAELKANNKRTFKLVDSPSSGEIFTKFKELHVIAGPEEDLNNIEKVTVDVSDLEELIRKGSTGGLNVPDFETVINLSIREDEL